MAIDAVKVSWYHVGSCRVDPKGCDGVFETVAIGVFTFLLSVLWHWLLSRSARNKEHLGNLPKFNEEATPMKLIETLLKLTLELFWGIGVNAAVSTLLGRLHNPLCIA